MAHLENINVKLRDLLLIFYENLTDSRISRSVWLSYVQGFQGWGVGRMIDGEFIKYDGLSGNHVLFFQALDAFLGMDRYLTDENMDRYIPVNQRNFCVALKEHSFRNKLEGVGNIEVEAEVTKIVNSLKVAFSLHYCGFISRNLGVQSCPSNPCNAISQATRPGAASNDSGQVCS